MTEALNLAFGALALPDAERGTSADGIEYLRVTTDVLPIAVSVLADAGFERFIDLTVVDDPDRPDRFELQYLLHSMADNCWVRLKARTAGEAPSITERFPAANWYEREVFDMFGVRFLGHPNLTRILMPDDWTGYPLRRDEALGGEPVEFSR
jgi:NADH-quinone oxidoreductase subunit C